MVVTVVSLKGGVAKTTTAVHLAGALNARGTTLLVDGDDNRGSISWAARGSLPFRVCEPAQMAKMLSSFKHAVVDTAARPKRGELADLAAHSDLLVVPATPDALSLEALLLTVEELRGVGADRFKVLLTIIPPPPSHDEADAREFVRGAGLELFKASIRRRVAFQKAALAGVLVSEVSDPRAELAWTDYLRVSREVLQ